MLRADGKPRQAGITRLYARYGRDFRGYFRRHGATEADAEDLLQETFIKVIRAIDTWNGSGALEAWLWTIARNTMMSQLRSAGGRPTTSLDDVEAEASEVLVSRHASTAVGDPADAECVARGLQAFAAKFAEYAHVLERVALDDWGYDELSRYRGCSEGAAREYLSQCRKRLWQFINHCFVHGAA